MFTFDFGSANAPGPDNAVTMPEQTEKGVGALREAKEHQPNLRPDAEAAQLQIEDVIVGSQRLVRVVLPDSALPELIGQENSGAAPSCAQLANSDLIPDLYEGGFKLWEGTNDLLEVVQHMARCGELEMEGATVLEAGCGAGLPGVLAMTLGAQSCVMQDYNAAVLTEVTMPTFQLNGLWPQVESGRVRFVSGDWSCVSAMLRTGNSGMDLILSAETIYNSESAKRLWQLVRENLSARGVALVAAKSYYFGVGGSVAEFKSMVTADSQFECRTVRVWEDGASNRRECLAIERSRKPKDAVSDAADRES